MKSLIGSHASISKGILEGIKYVENIGGNTLQIFLGSSTNPSLKYKKKLTNVQMEEIKKYIKKKHIKLFIHTIYSLNFCKYPPSDKRIKYAINNLVHDLTITEKIGGVGCVLHIGYQTDLEENEAYSNMVENVRYTIDITSNLSTKIILETPAGKGTQIGTTLEEFTRIWDMFPKKYHSRLGICVDTAHIFSSGRNIKTIKGIKDYIKDFDSLIGIKHLTLFHINDSKAMLNSRKDAHEGIGEGYIYDSEKGGNLKALKELWKIASKYTIPMVLETHGSGYYDSPKDNGKYKQEIALFRDWDNGLDTEKDFKLIEEVKMDKEEVKEYNTNIINTLKEVAKGYGITKDKIRKNVYDKAVYNLKRYPYEIKRGEDVRHLEGIGDKLVMKIDEILETGTLKLLDTFPKIEVNELETVLGIGKEFAKKLKSDYNIKDIKTLKKYVKQNKVDLNHTQKIGLEFHDELKLKVTQQEAQKVTKKVNKILEESGIISKYKLKVELAGSLSEGTGRTVSKDIDILMTSSKFRTKETLEKSGMCQEISGILYDKKLLTHVVSLGNTKILALCKLNSSKPHRHLDVRCVIKKSYVFARSYFTSGRDFNRMLRGKAKSMGYKLNEWGLYDLKGDPIKVSSEKQLFKILEMEYIPPNKRR